jgi:hypothetical protein
LDPKDDVAPALGRALDVIERNSGAPGKILRKY